MMLAQIVIASAILFSSNVSLPSYPRNTVDQDSLLGLPQIAREERNGGAGGGGGGGGAGGGNAEPCGDPGGTPTWRLDLDSQSIDNLPASMVVGGQTLSKVCEYRGDGATASAWSAMSGPALTLTGTGTSPVTMEPPPTTDPHVAVRFAGGTNKYYQASDAGAGCEIGGNKDVAIELIWRNDTQVGGAFVGKRSAGAIGYHIGKLTNQINFAVSDGTDSDNIASTGLDAGAWYHVLFVWDHLGGPSSVRLVVNGTETNNANFSLINDITSSSLFTLGALSDGASANFDSLLYLGIYTCTACLTDASGAEATALDRFQRFLGVMPETFAGTEAPSTMDRPAITTLEANGRIHTVGDDWMRLEPKGWKADANATNRILWSEDMSNAVWTYTRASVRANDTNGPFDLGSAASMDGVEATTANDTHCVETTNLDVGTDQHWVGGVLKAGQESWAYIELDTADDSPPGPGGDCASNGCTLYLDLSTCATGTASAPIKSVFAEAISGDSTLCRWGINYQANNTYRETTLRICGAEANGDNTYVGTAGVSSFYIDGTFMNDRVYSYIKTTSASAGSGIERLIYVMDDGNIGGIGSDKVGTLSMHYRNPGGVAMSTSDIAGGAPGPWVLRDSANAATQNISPVFTVSDTPVMNLQIDAVTNQLNANGTANPGGDKDFCAQWQVSASGSTEFDIEGVQDISGNATDIPVNLDQLIPNTSGGFNADAHTKCWVADNAIVATFPGCEGSP